MDVFVVLALIILLGLSAFFSGSEAALFSLSRSQIKQLQMGSAAGRQVQRLMTSPRRLLITILIGNLIVNVFSTSAVTAVAVHLFGDAGIGVAFVFMSILILIFGEIFPKALALNRPRKFSLFAIYPLRVFHLVFWPARVPMGRLTDSVIEFLKKKLGAVQRHFSREELLTAIDIGRDEGHLGEFEFELLSNIIEFRHTIVKEIMTPSINVFSLPVNMSRTDMMEQLLERGFSRVPIYGETTDDIKGLIHLKDLARAEDDDVDIDTMTLLRSPYVVPELTRISQLFKELGKRRSQFATVIDEYGSFVGIVTMEDILEELVGEIRDSREPHVSLYTLVDSGRIVTLAGLPIDEFNRVFDAVINDKDHETIGGYVIGATGRIPKEGETIDLRGLRFHIISAQPNRIRKMRVEKI